jgi:hypothetical protein
MFDLDDNALLRRWIPASRSRLIARSRFADRQGIRRLKRCGIVRLVRSHRAMAKPAAMVARTLMRHPEVDGSSARRDHQPLNYVVPPALKRLAIHRRILPLLTTELHVANALKGLRTKSTNDGGEIT